MEITKVVKPFIRRGCSNTFGNIVYISAVKVNALTQIPFNGTHFINAWLTQRVFSVWPMAQLIVGEMEKHIENPFSDFFPLKKAPKPYLGVGNMTKILYHDMTNFISR